MKVVEHIIRGKNFFIIIYGSNKIDRTVCITPKRISVSEQEYFWLYDSEFNVIRNVYRFINCNQFTIVPINTKLHYLYALKYLYEFCEIFDLKTFELTNQDVQKLKLFLSGYSSRDSYNSFQLLTNRSGKRSEERRVGKECRYRW